MAFKNALAVKREGEAALIESPVRESKANSHVERAIRTWRDQYRTLKHYTEHRLKIKITKGSALNSWLIALASEILNRFKVQANGRTSYEMMTQHRCRHKVVAFAEKVHFQHTKNSKGEYCASYVAITMDSTLDLTVYTHRGRPTKANTMKSSRKMKKDLRELKKKMNYKDNTEILLALSVATDEMILCHN